MLDDAPDVSKNDAEVEECMAAARWLRQTSTQQLDQAHSQKRTAIMLTNNHE
jgi:hypothetical protein